MTQYEGSMSRSFMLEKDWVRVRVAREQRKKSPVFVLTVQIKTKQLNDSDLVDSKIYNERIEVIL